MARYEDEFPIREEHYPVSDEFSLPREEAEYRPPAPEAEFSPPPGTDYENPDPALEFTPPDGRAELKPPRRRRRRLKALLFAAAAAVLLLSLSVREETVAPVPVIALPSPSPASEPLPWTSDSDVLPVLPPEATAEPAPEPTPAGKVPEISTDFFYFSHEHHARVRMANTGALHSVEVTVRETTLDLPVYDVFLSHEEIESGLFELPVLSTGDVYMEHMDEYETGGWPYFEMTVKAWYENEAGDGEDTLTLTVEPDYELGVGLSYIKPSWSWYETPVPDSFVIVPWEEVEDLRYVVNDPDAVKDPVTISVDLSYNGRHAAPEEYEEIVVKDEYDILNSVTGERTPHVAYTKELMLRRPDWMPEEGTVHVVICQRLASTGELWTREVDFDYTPKSEW